MKKTAKSATGAPALTFTEVVVSLAILALIVGATVSVFEISNSIWKGETLLIKMQEQVRLCLDGMAKEIRQSDVANVTFTGTDRIDFRIPASNNLIAYYLSGSNLLREHPPGASPRTLATDISGLSLARTGNVVTIDITASESYQEREHFFSLREQVRLRNELN